MEFVAKYFGILKDFDFNKITKDNFPTLIDKKIFIPRKLSNCYLGEEYFGLEVEKEPFGFSDFFLFNNKEYHLYYEIYDEMYLFDKSKIESDNKIDYHKKNIDFEIDIEENLFNKLRIIETKYLGYQSLINDYELYSLFKNENRYSDEIRNFSDYYENEIKAYEEYEGISNFLQGIDEFYCKELKETWETMHLVKEASYYLGIKKTEIKNDINNISINEIELNITSKIFKDNGFQIFIFLSENYIGLKNKAFFSYLYQFLIKHNKIVKNTKDNKKFREYVLSKYKIEMSRIIDSDVNTPATKDDFFKTFENLLESYSE